MQKDKNIESIMNLDLYDSGQVIFDHRSLVRIIIISISRDSTNPEQHSNHGINNVITHVCPFIIKEAQTSQSSTPGRTNSNSDLTKKCLSM